MRALTFDSSVLRMPGLRFHESLHLTVPEQRAYPDWRERLARNCARAFISDYRSMQPLWEATGREIPDPQLYPYDDGRWVAGHPATIGRILAAASRGAAGAPIPSAREGRP